MWCLKERQCEEIVLSNAWDIDAVPDRAQDPVLYCRCAPDMDSIFDAAGYLTKERPRCFTNSTVYCVMAFDATEEWAVADGCEGHHLIGGTPSFMQQYFDAAGGEEYVRAWFYHYQMWHGSFIGVDFDVLYRIAGWPKPVPPPGGLWADGEYDIDWSPMFGNRIKSCGPSKPETC